MNALTSPKSTYLLEAGIEILHEQSYEWLNEIEFWKDEAAFFKRLINNKTLISVPLNAKNNIQKIEQELFRLTENELGNLQNEVTQHEKKLNALFETGQEDKKTYRDGHKQLTQKIHEFEDRYKNLKKEVFALAESIDKN